MDSERWREVTAAFEAAFELEAEARDAYLADLARSDPRLAREVEALLAADLDPHSLVERGPFEGLSLSGLAGRDPGLLDPSAAGATLRPGARLGPFRILEPIAEGGMGAVWLAEQVEGITRKVAVKIIRPGVDTRKVLARFKIERRALARLDHEGIARIYDAGATADGQPYFAMEYLPDPPITTFCDDHRLDTSTRLTLFAKLCATIQYAHLKGLIHRDIKPSNVLVSVRDGRPIPKVIDFGIAKATGSEGLDRTVQTAFGEMLGTPEYMSPEQVGADPADIDTRTDVYSLGVLLYRLMVGVLPVDWSSLQNITPAEIRRVIREVDTPRPSTRLSTLGDAAEVARKRSTDPSELVRELRGDLDWIVLKAVEKDRSLRYQSANELAADVHRYLAHQPISARPHGPAYRLRKFVRRNRPTVVAAGLLLATAAFALGATGTLARRAEAARRLAEARFAELVRLSDLKRLQDATRAAGTLFPAYPENAARMERWLEEEARPLIERLPLHRATLDSLRSLALPQGAGPAPALPGSPRLEDDSVADELERLRRDASIYDVVLRRRRSAGDGPELLDALRDKRDSLRARAGELEATVADRGSWQFADATLQWEHDLLQELILGMGRFLDPDPHVGALAGVQRRLEQARSLERLAADPAVVAAWEEARREIAASETYGGLRLAPQRGLVPLGRDPVSGLWEFWHVLSGSRPRRNPDPSAPSRWLVEAGTGLVLVLIPGGGFSMGAQNEDPAAPNYDPLAQDHEGPVHRVELGPFFISKYEMTQAQWLRATGANPSTQNPVSPARPGDYTLAHPVEQISHEAAQRVFAELGLVFPTEAQWEYAARAGTTTPWPTGPNPASLQGAANIADRHLRDHGGNPSWSYTLTLDDGHAVHAPVGSYRPNGFGLHEVLGNVAEYCRDEFGPYGTAGLTAAVSSSKLGPEGERRVYGKGERTLRGGSWRSAAADVRVARRRWAIPTGSNEYRGVRPARRIDGVP